MEQRVVENTHDVARLQGYLHFFFYGGISRIHQELQTIVFFFQITQANHFSLAGGTFHVVHMEFRKIAGDDPPGALGIRKLGGVSLCLLKWRQQTSVRLADRLVQLFSQAFLLETVVLLSKGEIDSKKVRVEFSLEDMDMSGFQKGATYEQIKAYVLEHTGLKVSSLYISQIKRKCGLDVGQNYNLSKKEDAKVPKCPPEKEAAIRDALKYFQMI